MSEKKSFWTTLPGILTGIAMIISAVGGLIVGLRAAGIMDDKINEEREFTIIISVEGKGTTNPNPGSYTYDEGTRVSITALPNSDWEFDYWSGAISGTSPTITITLDADQSITAHFVAGPPGPARFSMTIRTEGAGTTNPSPGTYTYDEGTRVSITALPDTGWWFDHWIGDASGTSSETTISMDSNKIVTANFFKYSMQTQFIVAHPRFDSIGALDGCKIGVYSKDELSWQYAEVALSTYEITCHSIYMPMGEIDNALQLGYIDAMLLHDPLHPMPWLQSWIDRLDLNLLPWSSQAIQTVADKFPQMEATALPAGTYSGQEYDIRGYAPR